MQKTKIEWVKNPDGSQGYSWNPIRGLCPVGCWYCYARRIYQRFSRTRTPWLNHNEFGGMIVRKPRGVFVCSTFELFHPITLTKSAHSKSWRDSIFYAIEHTPNYTCYILTKLPQNIDRPMPDNVWLGITIEDDSENSECRLGNLYANENIREDQRLFLSVEPMFGVPDIPHIEYFDWLIIGRLTGFGKKHDLKKKDIEWLVNNYKKSKKGHAPVFLKNNLREIWGEPLIQEMPE